MSLVVLKTSPIPQISGPDSFHSDCRQEQLVIPIVGVIEMVHHAWEMEVKESWASSRSMSGWSE